MSGSSTVMLKWLERKGRSPSIVSFLNDLNAFVVSLYDIRNSTRMTKFPSRFNHSFCLG